MEKNRNLRGRTFIRDHWQCRAFGVDLRRGKIFRSGSGWRSLPRDLGISFFPVRASGNGPVGNAAESSPASRAACTHHILPMTKRLFTLESVLLLGFSVIFLLP